MPSDDHYDEALANEYERDFIDTPRKKRMTKRTPVLPPAAETLDDKPHADTAGVPAKLSKLSAAMQVVSHNATAIEALGVEIEELHRKWAPNTVWDLTTKEGADECDAARKGSRAVRLKIQNLRDEGKSLLNSLKGELITAAEGDIARAQAIENNAKTQQEAKALAEEARAKRHADNITAISVMAEGAARMTSVQLQERIQSMEAVIVDDSYEEFQAQAERKRREVVEVLVQARAAAIAREEQERQAAAARETAALELEESRQREAKRAAAKAKVDAIKALPDQLEGTDAANVREALRIHQANVPKAEDFGDMLDFAEMAHERTARLLKEMIDQLAEAEQHDAEEALIEQRGKETGLGGTQWTEGEQAQLASQDAPPLNLNTVPTTGTEILARQAATPGPDASIDMQPVDIKTSGNIVFHVGEQPSEPPVVRRAARVAAPAHAPALSGSCMRESPAPAPAPAAATEVPDLLKAAQDFITTVEETGTYDQLPESWKPAYTDLKIATDFASEFAD